MRSIDVTPQEPVRSICLYLVGLWWGWAMETNRHSVDVWAPHNDGWAHFKSRHYP